MTAPEKPWSDDEKEASVHSALDEFLPEEFEPPAATASAVAPADRADSSAAPSGDLLIVPAKTDAALRSGPNTLLRDGERPQANAPQQPRAGAASVEDDADFEAVVSAFSLTGSTSPAPASPAASPVRRELTAAPSKTAVEAAPSISAHVVQDSAATGHPSEAGSGLPEFMDETELASAARSDPAGWRLSRDEPEGSRAEGEGWAGAFMRTAGRRVADVTVAVQELAARFSRRDAAVITLCIIGLTELGWIGWRLASMSKPAAPRVEARPSASTSGVANPAPAPSPTGASAATAPGTPVPPSGGGAPAPPPSRGADTAAASPLPAAPVAIKPASLAIRTDPAGALVSIDGASRGRSPLTVSGLTPGTHSIVVSRPPNAGQQSVTLKAGESTTIDVPFDKTGPAPTVAAATAAATPGNRPSGWLTVASPVPVELFERGQRLASSGTRRVALSVGRHQIEAVNEPFGIRTRLTVDIVAGKTTPMKVEAPPGTVNVNALPWATVRIDGAEVGDTPLANLQLAAGQHEVIFRHPELGERRVNVVVQSGKSLRVSMDLRKKI